MFVEAVDASYRSTDLVFLRWMVLYKPSPLNTTIMSCLNLTPDQVWHVLPSLCDVLSLLGKGRVTFGKRKTKRRSIKFFTGFMKIENMFPSLYFYRNYYLSVKRISLPQNDHF